MFDLTKVSICGKYKIVADELSRQHSQVDKNTSSNTALLMEAIQRAEKSRPLESNEISHVTKDTKIYSTMENQYTMDIEFKDLTFVPRKPFVVSNNLIYYINRLLIPKEKFRLKVFHDMHESTESGHRGVKKTLD